MVKVLFFAGLAEKVGEQEVLIDAKSISVEELLRLLSEKYLHIATELDHVMVAVNEEFVDKTTIIQSNDTVALIPPVSGG